MTRYNFFLDDTTLSHLKRIQSETGVTVSVQIRQALELYLRSKLPAPPNPNQLELDFGS